MSKMDKSSSKVLPYSLEAEISLLGLLILQQDVWDSVEGVLVKEDFYDQKHAHIFWGISQLINGQSSVDIVTLIEFLTNAQVLEASGGAKYIYHLVDQSSASFNIKEYIQIIKDKALTRALLATTTSLTQTIYHPEGRSAHELVQMAESNIFKISQNEFQKDSVENISDVLARATEKIQKMYQNEGAMSGTPTGYKDLDALLAGLHDGDLFIIAGRPSMGKTMFSVNIAEYVALSSKKPVVFFSLEMPSELIVMRMLSSLGRIKQERIRTGQLKDDDWPRMTSAMGMLSQAPFFIDDTGGISPGQLRSKVRRIARTHGDIGLILVDYLQLMKVPELKDNRVLEISEISRSLKMIAKEFNTTVIALSQLNRSLENRTDRRPMMSDLRESGAIEQDADVIAFVYRDEVYHPDSPDKGSAEIIIGKQRNGPIGMVRLTYLGDYMRFDNYVNEHVVSG